MPALAGIIFLIGFLTFTYFSPKPEATEPIAIENFKHETPNRRAVDDLRALNAASAVVLDDASGFRLLDRNADELRPIASLTKLMTALVFLEHNPGWDKTVTIEKSDLRSGAKANIFVDDRIIVSDLFSLALVASDNSAISALVRSTGLSEQEFVAKMNSEAQRRRLRGLVFTDPTGLDIHNKGTAVAVAKLAEIAIAEPQISRRVLLTSLEFSVSPTVSRSAKSTNQLLGRNLPKEAILIGGKTGHLDEAGYCFAGVFEVEGKRLITAVLGAPLDEQRFSETIKMLDWTIGAYLWEN